MASTQVFSTSTEGLPLRPQELQKALPLDDVEYLLALQTTPYKLVLVNPGVGNVAQVFATHSLCERIDVVGGTTAFQATMKALELDEFVLPLPAVPTTGLDATVVLWDDTVGGVPLTVQAVETLGRAQTLILRKPLEWTPPVGGVWDARPSVDRRTVLFMYKKQAEVVPPVGAPPATGGLRVGLISAGEKEEWQRKLVAFLRAFLGKFITAPSVDAYLEPRFLPMWYDAFTHEVVDPNANYETLEFVGDVALENAVSKYLVARFPTATKGQYNEMKRSLVEKQGLKQVSRILGLSSMLLTFKNTQHLAEDVVESFLGALATISDQLVAGLGDINVYNYVVWYYNQQDISPEREGRMPAKTIVQQIFQKFFEQKMGMKQDSQPVPNGFRVQVTVPNNIVDDMKRVYGKDIKNVLGEAVAGTIKAAESKAYQAALDNLTQLGITFEWAERVQREREFNAPEMQRYYQAALSKARGEGFTELVLLKSSTLAGKEGTLVGLAGVLPNGKRTTLAIGEGSQRFDAAVAAVRAYVSL